MAATAKYFDLKIAATSFAENAKMSNSTKGARLKGIGMLFPEKHLWTFPLENQFEWMPPTNDVLALLQVLFKLLKQWMIDTWQLVFNTTTTTVVFNRLCVTIKNTWSLQYKQCVFWQITTDLALRH